MFLIYENVDNAGGYWIPQRRRTMGSEYRSRILRSLVVLPQIQLAAVQDDELRVTGINKRINVRRDRRWPAVVGSRSKCTGTGWIDVTL